MHTNGIQAFDYCPFYYVKSDQERMLYTSGQTLGSHGPFWPQDLGIKVAFLRTIGYNLITSSIPGPNAGKPWRLLDMGFYFSL